MKKARKAKVLTADIISVIPEVCESYLQTSILGRAAKAKLLDLRTHNLRDWAENKHNRVDDKPFGGGAGMVMQVGPFHRALMALKVRNKKGGKTAAAKKTRVILTSAKGKVFTQADAARLSGYDRLVFLCGRYEGVDERVAEILADEELSIGKYVLTGGELPAMVMLDAAARLRPGVLGAAESLHEESWSDAESGEYPHYTRPAEYLGKKVPDVLLSGDHAAIAEWRKRRR